MRRNRGGPIADRLVLEVLNLALHSGEPRTGLLCLADLPDADLFAALSRSVQLEVKGLFAKQLLSKEGPGRAVTLAASAVYQENLARNMILRHETNLWVDRLRSAGIPCRILKGVHASVLLYEDLGAKTCADIDVLVPREQLERAIRVAAESGFVPSGGVPEASDEDRHGVSFESSDIAHPYQLDLHWRLDSALMVPLDEDEIFSAPGPPGPVPILPHDLMGVLLCLHLWRHAVTLKTLVDFAAYVRRYDACLPDVRRRLAAAGVENGLKLALGLTQRIFGVRSRHLPDGYGKTVLSGWMDRCLRLPSHARGRYFDWLVLPLQFDGVAVTTRRVAAHVFRSTTTDAGRLARLARLGSRVAFTRHRFILPGAKHEQGR